MTQPIFITGAQRTGTTWVASVLGRSEQTIVYDEPFNKGMRDAGRLGIHFPNWFTYIGAHNHTTYYAPIHTMLGYRYRLLPKLMTVTRPYEVKKVFNAYQRTKQAARQGARHVIKQPTGIFMAEWFAQTFNAIVLVMVRHPAGFVSSRNRIYTTHEFADHLKQPELMRDHLSGYREVIERYAAEEKPVTEQNALLWKLLYGTAAKLNAEHPDWIFLRMEDLAADPVSGYTRLFDLLSLDFTPAVRQHVEELSRPSNPAEVALENRMSVRRDSSSIAKIWEKRLTPEQIETIKHITEPVWREFYTEDDW